MYEIVLPLWSRALTVPSSCWLSLSVKIALSEFLQKIQFHSVSFYFPKCMLQSQGIIIFCWDQGCHLALGAHPPVCHMCWLWGWSWYSTGRFISRKAVMESHNTYHSCPVQMKIYSLMLQIDVHVSVLWWWSLLTHSTLTKTVREEVICFHHVSTIIIIPAG
jgi:hypothetical protein